MTTNRTPPRRRHTPAAPRSRKDRGQHRPSRSDRRAVAAETAEAAAVTQWDLPTGWDSPTPATPSWARDEGWAEKDRWAALPKARKRRRRPWLRTTLIAVAAFIAGAIFGAAAVTGRAPAATGASTVNADADADAAAQSAAAPAPAPATAASSAVAAVPNTAPSVIPSAPKDGVNVVNRDVAPGHYRTSGGSGGCYWERLRSTSGGAGDVITNAFETGPAVVTILSSDAAFMSQGCGPWTPLG